MFAKFSSVLSVFVFSFLLNVAHAQDSSLAGTYKALLIHEPLEENGPKNHQFATITLRTVNPGDGTLKISGNVRLFFGDANSNEFLTYDYPEVSMNLLTRQISLKNEAADVTFLGTLKNGIIQGEWFSSVRGRVGAFEAQKNKDPKPPADSTLVKSVTGHYRGLVENTNPDSNLPEKMTISLVTTQNNDDGEYRLQISGNMRFYLGEFNSTEYVETPISQASFNFYNRFITLKTRDYGVTIKGVLHLDGTLEGDVFADGYGKVGRAHLKAIH